LNVINLYLLNFPEERHKYLDLDQITEILSQAKPRDPEWYKAKVNAIIENFLNCLMKNQFLTASVW
jgi:hypothetical protein